MAENKRMLSTPDEKLLKAIQALFILNATQLRADSHDMRKILGVDMNDITLITKAINKALKKASKKK